MLSFRALSWVIEAIPVLKPLQWSKAGGDDVILCFIIILFVFILTYDFGMYNILYSPMRSVLMFRGW